MNPLQKQAVAFLRWTEKYTKTDMVYLATGGFWGLISQFGLAGMTFGLAVAFAHLVPKETYGQYKYVLSIVSLLGTLTLSGIGTAVLQSVSNGYEGTLSYAFWQNIKWSIFFFCGAGVSAVYYFTHGNHILGISLLVVGCLWPFFNSTNLYSSLLVAKKDFRRITLYFDIIGNLIPYLCLFGLMFITTNPLWFVLVYIISNTVIGIILYIRVTSLYQLNDRVDPDMLGYSKHLSFIAILSGVADNIDQILVFHYIGAAQLAIYNFATALPDQIKGPIKNIANLIFPKFAVRTDTEIEAGMSHKYLVLLATSLVVIGLYIFIAPFVYTIFFPKYIESIFYSQIFSISLLFMVAIPANTYLTAKKKIKEQYIVNISMAIFQIIIVFISIINWGLLGLIIARVLVRIVSALVSMLLYKLSVQPIVVDTA